MGFFDEMLAGAAAGAGRGAVEVAAERQKAEERAALAEERNQIRREQIEMQDRYNQGRLDNFRDRYGLDGGSAAGGAGSSRAGGKGAAGGFNLAEMIPLADTPEKQDALIRQVETFIGPDAAAQLADKGFGRPRTYQDTITLRGGIDSDFAETSQQVTKKVSYDAEKGTRDLQRAFVLFQNAANIDNFAKADKDFYTTDLARNAKGDDQLEEAGKRSLVVHGKPLYGSNGTDLSSGENDWPDAPVRGSAAKPPSRDWVKQQDQKTLDSAIAAARTAQGSANIKAANERVAKLQAAFDAKYPIETPAPAPAMPASRASQFKVIKK